MEQKKGDCQPVDKKIVLLENDLARLETELDSRYYELGKSIYEMADRQVDDINSLVDKLVETKRQISLSRSQRQCSQCFAVNHEENHFCGNCGEKMEETKQEETT